MITRISISMT